MSRYRQRRFGLLDLMVVIAAIALGLAPFRMLERGLDQVLGPSLDQGRITRFETYAVPPLAALTLAALARSLIPPRPPLRRLARRPGFLACAAAVACLAVIGTAELGWEVSKRGPPQFRDTHIAFMVGGLANPVGGTVAGAWLSLVLRGAWRGREAPSDRLGQALGVGWISLLVLGCFRP
jgi:hypothetical protein